MTTQPLEICTGNPSATLFETEAAPQAIRGPRCPNKGSASTKALATPETPRPPPGRSPFPMRTHATPTTSITTPTTLTSRDRDAVAAWHRNPSRQTKAGIERGYLGRLAGWTPSPQNHAGWTGPNPEPQEA